MDWKLILQWTELVGLGAVGVLSIVAAFATRRYAGLLLGAACVTAMVSMTIRSEWLFGLALLMMLAFALLMRKAKDEKQIPRSSE